MSKKRYCNVRRMNKLIAALKTEAAGHMFNMNYYIHCGKLAPRDAFKSGGQCGTSACIAGMAAIIAPRFFTIENGYAYAKRLGDWSGLLKGFNAWLEIPNEDGELLTEPDMGVWLNSDSKDISHAINVLEAYRNGGMDLVEKIEGVELA